VIIDYLWGPPTEALLTAITGTEFAVAGSETRLVEVGESAGPNNHPARCSAAEHGADDSRNGRHSALGRARRGSPTGDEPRSERQTAH
jgi:hypothetical protein